MHLLLLLKLFFLRPIHANNPPPNYFYLEWHNANNIFSGVGIIDLETCVLGSGSKGNSIFFKSKKSKFLVDAGLSARQIKLRMKEIGQDPKDLDFILVTHEHSDHIKGIARLVKLYGTKIMMNNKTYGAVRAHLPEDARILDFTTGEEFRFMDLHIIPLSISHDAADPVSFIIRTGSTKAAVMTDLGFVSNEMFRELKDLDIFILESNHDLDMLMGGPYPLFLKRRISSLTGHLSNTAAAETLIKISPKERSHIFLAHISETNNHPDIAYSSVRELLEENKALARNLHLTYQDRPTGLFQSPL